MNRRQKLGARLVVGFLITTGWLLNSGYHYFASVFHRAAVCEETNCLDVQQVADQMKSLGLPTTKESNHDAIKSKLPVQH